MMRYDVLALALLFCAILWLIHRRNRARVKAARGAFFASCLSLFERYRVIQDDVDYPSLEGRYRGHEVRLQPIVDHIAVRKLPSLWLLVTVLGEVPFRGAFDLLARPQNIEFYSPSDKLEVSVATPPGWPTHAVIRTDAPDAMPPQELLAPHIAMFDDPKTKELLVTPRGVRVVYQVDQAQRSYYLVLRQAAFDEAPLSPALAARLLDRAVALYDDLRQGAKQA